MNRKLRCVIVDDEPIARYGIESYVRKFDWLECVGTFENAFELDRFLKETQCREIGAECNVDIIFIDIEMPGITGMEYLGSVNTKAAVIVITAYEEYALKGYELNVTDYLLKPVSFARFLKAVNKAREYCMAMEQLSHSNNAENTDANAIFVKSDRIIHRLILDEIYFVEGMENYVKIHTHNGVVVTRASLKSVIAKLPEKSFMQVHKSYVVNFPKIESVEGNMLHFGNRESVPVSRSYKQKLFEKLTLSHFLDPDL